MDVAINTSAVRKSLYFLDPGERGAALLEALGWHSRAAAVYWPSTPHAPGRFVLDGLPTEAGITISGEPLDPDTAWIPGWLAGHRWHVVPGERVLWWFDLNAKRVWSARADDDLQPLEGLTPSGFRRLGRFEPQAADLETRETLRPPPSRYLVERIRAWWKQYYGSSLDSPQAEIWAKEHFVRFLAGLLLLRTIEDLDRVSWFPQGSLLRAAKVAADGSGDELTALFSLAAQRLNSRVLRGIAEATFPASLAGRIVTEAYDIDFSALDVDPVGAFYEEIIGTSHGRRPSLQTTLFGPDMVVDEDRDARRRRGVYYTPRAYADTLATLLVRPQAHVARGSDDLPRVLDLAAGSGELLCAALREILSEPAWRDPSVVLHLLDQGIHAVDTSAMALQLCALNLLRTAVRHVPALLDCGERLPRLERNLVQGDALSVDVLDRLPEADVVLINPPFHGPRHWQLESSDAIPELRECSLPNQALAFTLASIRCLRPGGGLGVILPSQLLDGINSIQWRHNIARDIALELVVANYANPFPDVQSYAGMIVGYRRGEENWRPRTRVVRIDGGLRLHTADIGVLLGETGSGQPMVESALGPPVDESTATWLEALSPPTVVYSRQGRTPLASLLGSANHIHQGVVVAPQPWGRRLFLFEQLPNGQLRHVASSKILRGESLSFRPVAWANRLLHLLPVWCEPELQGVLLFHPGDGVTPVTLDSLRDSDLVAYEAGLVIRQHVLATSRNEVSASGMAFFNDVKAGKLRFHLPKGYRHGSLPRLVFAKTSRSAVGRERGLLWSSWLNLDGSVVPLDGNHLIAQRPEDAAAIATWLCIDEVVGPLIRKSPARRLGTTQPRLRDFAAWEVPDLYDDRIAPRLSEHYSAFLDYREEAGRTLTPEQAAALPVFRDVLALGRALWEPG